MSFIFIVKDRSNQSIKPFISVHKSIESAQRKINGIRSKLQPSQASNIMFESFAVKDFDMNKSNIYMLINKMPQAEKNQIKFIDGFFFDIQNASQELMQKRKKFKNQEKMIYINHCQIE